VCSQAVERASSQGGYPRHRSDCFNNQPPTTAVGPKDPDLAGASGPDKPVKCFSEAQLRPVCSPSWTDVAHILSAIENGDPSAAEQLLPLVYDELRKLAAQRLPQESRGHFRRRPHEAYVRLVASGDASAPQEEHWLMKPQHVRKSQDGFLVADAVGNDGY
jgi:hypothetical protein